jgi:riboflavin biosynthesis pyrimidine reductase
LADVVLLGAGTFRKSGGHLWHPDRIYPAAAAIFAQTREQLGLSAAPRFALVSASGAFDTAQPALENAWVFTTPKGEAALRGKLLATTRVTVQDSERIDLPAVLQSLRSDGLQRILTEGGPSLFAQLIAQRAIDELFLTSAPALFGRFAEDHRKSLADGFDLSRTPLELLSARRHGSHLFLRYALKKRELSP